MVSAGGHGFLWVRDGASSGRLTRNLSARLTTWSWRCACGAPTGRGRSGVGEGLGDRVQAVGLELLELILGPPAQ